MLDRLPAPAAVAVLLTDPANGHIYVRGHVEWGAELDRWPMGCEIGQGRGESVA